MNAGGPSFAAVNRRASDNLEDALLALARREPQGRQLVEQLLSLLDRATGSGGAALYLESDGGYRRELRLARKAATFSSSRTWARLSHPSWPCCPRLPARHSPPSGQPRPARAEPCLHRYGQDYCPCCYRGGVWGGMWQSCLRSCEKLRNRTGRPCGSLRQALAPLLVEGVLPAKNAKSTKGEELSMATKRKTASHLAGCGVLLLLSPFILFAVGWWMFLFGPNEDQRQIQNAIMETIEKDPGRINAPFRDGKPPLHLALEHHLPGLFRWLLARGADPNARAQNGQTALHEAVYCDEDDNRALRALLNGVVKSMRETSMARRPFTWQRPHRVQRGSKLCFPLVQTPTL